MDNSQQTRRWLRDFSYEWWKSFIMGASARLELFQHLKNPKSIDELAEITGYSARALRIILDALTAMGIIDKKGEGYTLGEKAAPFLGRNDLFSYESYLQLLTNTCERWASLPEVIKTGKPAVEKRDPDFFVSLTRSLFAVNWQEAQELYSILKQKNPLNILDIGAGSCPWSIPFVKHNKKAHVTVIDLSQVIDGSSIPTVTELGLLERYTFYSGSFWDISWGSGYDLIIMGHICHMLDREANIALFKKVQNALAPHGVLVMIDYIPDEERRERLFPLLFAVNMLINTDGGDVYTFSQYKDMLSYAGFKDFSLIHLNDRQGGDVVVASP